MTQEEFWAVAKECGPFTMSDGLGYIRKQDTCDCPIISVAKKHSPNPDWRHNNCDAGTIGITVLQLERQFCFDLIEAADNRIRVPREKAVREHMLSLFNLKEEQ